MVVLLDKGAKEDGLHLGGAIAVGVEGPAETPRVPLE